MKKGLVIITAGVIGFLAYTFFKKKYNTIDESQSLPGEKHKNHHLTTAFAKAKRKSLS